MWITKSWVSGGYLLPDGQYFCEEDLKVELKWSFVLFVYKIRDYQKSPKYFMLIIVWFIMAVNNEN